MDMPPGGPGVTPPVTKQERLWLGAIYNARGYMSENMWDRFARFCEKHGYVDDPTMDQLED